jgi:maltooligosyltrehalose synthase
VPRLVATLRPDGTAPPLGKSAWGDTRVHLPHHLPAQAYRNAFTGATVRAEAIDHDTSISAADIFEHFPVALLTPERPAD